MSCHPAFGSRPGNLFRDVSQIGSVHVGVHGACFEAHGGDREILVDDASVGVIRDHLVDCPIDLLAHMAAETLTTRTARGRELFHALLLETGT